MTKQQYIEVTKHIYTTNGECAKCGYHTPIKTQEATLNNLYKYEGKLYDRVCLWEMVEDK